MPKSEERLLTVRELAEYMQMNERTILKLVNLGKLPGAKIASQWRFKRGVIDQWIEEQMNQGGGEAVDLTQIQMLDAGDVPLSDLLEPAGVIADMRAGDRATAIEELAARAFSAGWITDKPWFVGALVERETLASTAVDGGVAFLHTRQREARKVARPFIVVGRSYPGIDFGASDGKQTYLFFLLGLKYDKLHLPILGRLARILRAPALVARLRAAPTASRIRDLLLQEDHRLLQAPPKAVTAKPTATAAKSSAGKMAPSAEGAKR